MIENQMNLWTGPVINLEAMQEMPHVDGYSRLKSSPKHDTHSSREIRWSLSISHIFVKVLTQRFGFTTFLTSLRRSRYSVLSRKLSLSVSITENFQSRTCRSESCCAVCASVPTGPKYESRKLTGGIVNLHVYTKTVNFCGVRKMLCRSFWSYSFVRYSKKRSG